MRLAHAEQLLQELGVTEPGDIDLEAIAHYVGAKVRFRKLEGCEAHIVGGVDQAIITINDRSPFRRSRFSIAHELGHWRYHRGRQLVCRVDDFHPRTVASPERVADSFAADLLMPHYLFKPLARRHAKLTFKAVDALAEEFKTSRTATAIRLVESDHSSAVLVCHRQKGRKWFTRAPSVPEKWFPREELDAQSSALGVLFGKVGEDAHPRRIGADAWFDRWDAKNFEVYEQSIRTGDGEIVTIITVPDSRMLRDEDDRGHSRFR